MGITHLWPQIMENFFLFLYILLYLRKFKKNNKNYYKQKEFRKQFFKYFGNVCVEHLFIEEYTKIFKFDFF